MLRGRIDCPMERPDGSIVVVEFKTGKPRDDHRRQLELYVAERTDSGTWGMPRQLTARGGWAGRWAPDGHAIVYCRPDGVWLIAPDGRAERQLVDVRGIGLMAAVEMVADKKTKAAFDPSLKIADRVANEFRNRGVYTRARGDVIMMAPPLMIPEDLLDRSIKIIGDTIDAIYKDVK